MQEGQPINTPPSNLGRRVIIIVACLIAIIAVGAGMVFLLKNLATTKDGPTGEQAAALNPAQIVAEYSKQDTIAGLNATNYSLQPVGVSEGSVIYKASGEPYVIDTITKETALFSAIDPKLSNDTSLVQEQTTAFMTQKGYSKTDNVGSATSKNPSFVTYESTSAVCQLASSHPEETTSLPPYHKLACVTKEVIEKEYAAVNSLLELYKKDNKLDTVTEVIRTVKSEENKTMAILDLLHEGKQTSLLFAAIDSTWAYVGNLSEGSPGDSNGKYSLSPQVQQAMSDPKYGDFLTKNVRR